MSQEKIYPVAELGLTNSHFNRESYERLYKKSIEFPEEFWSEPVSYTHLRAHET